MKQNKPIVIGLTGASGSGKTEIASILKSFNAFIIDADKVYHSLIKKGEPIYNEIVRHFGLSILDNNKEIDRKRLANIVFSNKNDLNTLNSITHKYIVKKITSEIENAKNIGQYSYIVLDAPLLIETGLDKLTDDIWLVHADFDTRLDRLIKRDNLDKKDIIKRLNNQTSFEKLAPFASFIIHNNGDYNNLKKIIKNQLNLRSF